MTTSNPQQVEAIAKQYRDNPELFRLAQEAWKKTRTGFTGVTAVDQTKLTDANIQSQTQLQEHIAAVQKMEGEVGVQRELKNYARMSLHNRKRGWWAAHALGGEMFHFSKPGFALFAWVGGAVFVLTLAVIITVLSMAGGGEFVSPWERVQGAKEGIFTDPPRRY